MSEIKERTGMTRDELAAYVWKLYDTPRPKSIPDIVHIIQRAFGLVRSQGFYSNLLHDHDYETRSREDTRRLKWLVKNKERVLLADRLYSELGSKRAVAKELDCSVAHVKNLLHYVDTVKQGLDNELPLAPRKAAMRKPIGRDRIIQAMDDDETKYGFPYAAEKAMIEHCGGSSNQMWYKVNG